ncbi:AAA family ATPase [Kouleothrix sp.]|uniref:AAA family ATPase n=1 Tax=Kouleothrix sp. TaxID=2779161 RepID=UPI00391B0B2D
MPAHATFTPLSEADLSELFRDDAEGLRRYRLLHAVLAESKTQREAAVQFQVSERTIRNILRAYAQGSGLEGLRSRPAGNRRRRDRRPSPFEQALAEALAEEADAGGDRLWRRAQDLLGADGARLSRRTAYRILAQLRADRDDDAPDSLRGTVKSALPLLPEDPPLALGNSTLAQRLLPADIEQLPRGTLLQQALREALDQLRPAGPISTIDRNWWPYLICTGEYETGQSRAELQDDLALSASTYSRAKRQGIDRIAALVPQIVERALQSPIALASQQLPRTPDFVGRHDEQAYYAWRLQTEGLAHVWGLPGSGKTALAAELAAEGRRYGQLVLWHACRAGRDSTLLGMLRGLAQALAAAGDDALWREIRQTPLDEHDPDALLDALRDRLLARPAVIVLDDIHRADGDEIAALLDALADLVARRSSRLLLVGRDPLDSVLFPPLPGLTEREAELLWAGAPPLPDEQWRQLYASVGGMPGPIRRAAAAYRRNGELARPTDWSKEVQDWAEELIWDRLDDPARRLLAAAQALEPQPWGEQAALVCEALEIPAATLRDLSRRDLLHIAGPSVTIYNALRGPAGALLRHEAALREQVAALAADLASAPAVPPPAPTAEPPAPAGTELLARVHSALEDSAAYLRELSHDDARQLVAELAALQAALPVPGGPRRPFGRASTTAPPS